MATKNDGDFLRKLLDGTFESEFEQREKELELENQLGQEPEKNDDGNKNSGIEIGNKDQMTRLSVSLSGREKTDVERLVAEVAEQGGAQINKSEIIRIAIKRIKNISVEELIDEYQSLKKNRTGRPYKNISG